MTFSDAKDQIAKELHHRSFTELDAVFFEDVDLIDNVLEKAAELYAEEKAREAWDRAWKIYENEILYHNPDAIIPIKPPYQPK